MRVVNMAHGSFYLLAGYIAYEVQQKMTGQGGFAIAGVDVSTWEWVLPVLVAAAIVAVVGVVVQQTLLRWNQGQDLRQALLTIAVSVIVADQVIAHFPRSGAVQVGGGNAVSLTWPGWTERRIDLQVWNIDYSLARLVMLALGVAVGVALWLWLYRTRTGKVIRAGVDDPQMTSALGINIQKTFAIAFADRRGAGGARRGRRELAGQRRLGSGRPVAAERARRRDRRRDGIAAGRGGGRPALCARADVLRRVPADHERQLLLAVLDRAHVRADRDRARVPPARASSGGPDEGQARPEGAPSSA